MQGVGLPGAGYEAVIAHAAAENRGPRYADLFVVSNGLDYSAGRDRAFFYDRSAWTQHGDALASPWPTERRATNRRVVAQAKAETEALEMKKRSVMRMLTSK